MVLSDKLTAMKMTALLLTLLSAVLLPLALPNDIYIYGNPLLGFICLAPLFAAIVMAPSFKFASLLGMVFGGLSTLLVHYWLLFYGEYSIWTVSGVVLGYIGYHALLAPILFGLSRLYPSYRGFLLASTWALYEYLKSSGFLAFPWGLLPHSFSTVLPLVQFIDITGLWGLSLFAALANTFLAECILLPYHLYRRKVSFLVRNFSFLFFIGILVVSYGFYRLNKPMAQRDRLKVLMVQHNENPWETGKGEDAILRAQNLTLSGLQKGDPDIIVWSETAIKYYIREEQFARVMERIPRLSPLGPFIRETGKYFLIGAPFRPLGTPGYQNAALFISPSAELLGSYGKQQLVPIAEVVPFWDIGFVRTFFKQVLGLTQGWTRGTETTLFRVPIQTGGSLTFGTPICFEDAFPNLCRKFIKKGADLWINITNVSWSRQESAEVQMLVAARFRSIENHRYFLRCTNGGVTSVIDSKGRILYQLELFAPQVLFADLPLEKEQAFTPYTVYGDYLPWLLALMLLVVLVFQNRFRWRRPIFQFSIRKRF